jgi:hypothetical protein
MLVLAACVTVLGAMGAIAGTVLAAGLLKGTAPTEHASHLSSGPWSVAQDVPTSFGFVAVEHAETFKGLSPRQLGGATHGIGNFVGRQDALVQASVTITNTQGVPLRYSTRQFRLAAIDRKGHVRRIGLSHATVGDGVLQPDAAIDARLSFTVPRDGARLQVEFADPGARAPLVIKLPTGTGRLTKADRRALAEGHHAIPDAGTAAHDAHGNHR